MNRNHLLSVYGATALVLLLGGCAKTRFNPPLPSVAVESSASTIRLFNFYNANADITVNNIPLTNYGSSQATAAGLSIFPTGTWPNQDDGAPFVIPTSLLDKQGNAHIVVQPSPLQVGYNVTQALTPIDTVLNNDPLNPKDYYLLFDGSMQILPRNSAAPSQPDHFKIRIINLMQGIDNAGFLGKITLTYADGSVVSAATSGIDSNHVSDYVELPLGAYEFKLFLSKPGGTPDFTKQLAELPVQPNFNGFAPAPAQPSAQESLFPKIRTFKAGGTYSLVVTKGVVTQTWPQGCCLTESWAELVNAYRVVTEQAPAAPNGTYACMDAVNAINASGVSITVDGMPLGSNLSFGGYAGHKVYIWGNHHVVAADAQGNVLGQNDIMMYANDYLTAWAYTDSTGKGAVAFSSTDMTSTQYQVNAYGQSTTPGNAGVYYPVTDDGTNGGTRIRSYNYSWQSRFLNLSQDIPYVTFGNDLIPYAGGYAGGDQLFVDTKVDASDSTQFADATENLTRGYTHATEPFLIYQEYGGANYWTWVGDGTESLNNGTINPPGNQIIAFSSSPGSPPIVPGEILGAVNGLTWSSFIARPAMYTVPTLQPRVEPGFYSVALIGNVSAGTGRLIYVKHNQ
jgi:hypothetical protein